MNVEYIEPKWQRPNEIDRDKERERKAYNDTEKQQFTAVCHIYIVCNRPRVESFSNSMQWVCTVCRVWCSGDWAFGLDKENQESGRSILFILGMSLDFLFFSFLSTIYLFLKYFTQTRKITALSFVG